MKAKEIDVYLRSLVSTPERTVDRVVYGDPDREVSGVAVCWMPYMENIKEAYHLGINVMVVHEPTFYTHWDLQGKTVYTDAVDAKKRLIDDCGITIIRCHDVWDSMPDIGIACMWGRFLELGKPVNTCGYLHTYEIPRQKAITFAKGIAKQTSRLGQAAIGFYGDPDRYVSKVGIGTGCICEPWDMYKMGADIVIVADDAIKAWEAGEWFNDTGFPAIVVNHAVSEIPAMDSLAVLLRDRFPGLKLMNLLQSSSYKSIIDMGSDL